MSSDFHLVQNCFFKPVMETMMHAGVNIRKLLQKSDLSQVNLDNSEKYVPVKFLYKLLFDLHKYRGVD